MLEVDRIILGTAGRFLGDIPNIALGLALVNENPADFQKRISQFDSVINHLNHLIINAAYQAINPDYYHDVAEISYKLRGQPLPTLSTLVGMCDNHGNLFTRVFVEIKRKIRKNKWPFANQEENPNILSSGLLIEGYAVLAERYFRKRGLARTFVLGFEAALLAQARYLEQNVPVALFEDIKPWMEAEIADLPPAVQKELQQLF